VALRLIDGVCLGDPKSWMGRENDGSVLSWEDAHALAAEMTVCETDGPDL
jgi:hypothetical protein